MFDMANDTAKDDKVLRVILPLSYRTKKKSVGKRINSKRIKAPKVFNNKILVLCRHI